MTDTARQRAERLDLVLPDRLPTCPKCGNLCGRLAQRCRDCGTGLYEFLWRPEPVRRRFEDTQSRKGKGS